MNKEEKIKISVNEEDIQNLINCYKKDIEYIMQLEKENKKYKEVIDKAITYINDNLIISSILDGKKYYTINDYSFDYKELLDILKEVNK